MQDKGDGLENAVSSPTATNTTSSSTTATSSRLTGRTASQVQGAARVSNQLGLNEVCPLELCDFYEIKLMGVDLQVSQLQQQQQSSQQQQQPQQSQQQLLTGRPLVKGQEVAAPFQQQHINNRPGMATPFNQPLPSNAAITGVAVKLLEQQHQQQQQQHHQHHQQQQHHHQQQQQQLLAAAVAASQNQQMKQRVSPLQQSLLAFAGAQGNMNMQNLQNRGGIPPNVPVANRTHFRPIHPQPMVPPVSGKMF